MPPIRTSTTTSRGNSAATKANSLGLGPRELKTILDQFDVIDSADKKSAHRNLARWPFRKPAIAMKLVHPGRNETELWVAGRNLSHQGVGVLHNAYIHPGTRCIVALPHPKKGPMWFDGTIVRCIHRGGMMHEAGIKFDAPINARDYVVLDPLVDWFSREKVDAEALHGTVVLAEESEVDRRILRHFLRETLVRIREAKGVDDAAAMCAEGCDLLIVGYHREVGTGVDLVTQLRERGVSAPVLMTTSDTSAPVWERMRRVHINAALPKPISQSILLRAIAEFLTTREEPPTLDPSAGPDDFMNNLVREYIEGLHQWAEELEEASGASDPAAALTICQKIKGSAPSVGLQVLAKLADEAASSLTRSKGTQGAAREIRALIAACEQARTPG
jgi:CheY-like chemotaxis protein